MSISTSSLETAQARWLAERRNFLEDGAAAHALLKLANGAGEHLLAVEIAEAVLAEGLVDPAPILQQMGRALAALRSSEEARSTLERIPAGRPDAAETLGLLGRVSKDLADAATGPGEREGFLDAARKYYLSGFQLALERGDRNGAAYCGINAAALNVLLGNPDEASSLAIQTLEQAGEQTDYYSIATRAEAAFILGKEEAPDLYRQTAEKAAAEKRWADLASTRRQCRELSLKLHGRRDHLDSSFPPGAIAVFSGEPASALTEEDEERVRKIMKEWLAANGVREAFGSARAGWDLVMLSTAQDMGIGTHLLLPCPVETFIENHVRPQGESWVGRFKDVLEKASTTTVLGSDGTDSSITEFTDRMIAARGSLLADHLGFDLRALAVAEDPAHTALALWLSSSLQARVLRPSAPDIDAVPDKEATPDAVPFQRALSSAPGNFRTQVCSFAHLHFADYSLLAGEEFEAFQKTVLGTIAARLAISNHPPVARQGFGGDYLLVFDELYPAGIACLDLLAALKDAVDEKTGKTFQLPSLCLNAGPTRQLINPVLNFYAHEGSVVTRTGAIARLLPAGSLCATETFTALSSLESLRGFRFEHAGKIAVGDSSERLFRLYPP